jgi:hypothetical protein
MTDDMMALKPLCEKTSDADLLNEMIGFAANRLMELETDVLCNAGRHDTVCRGCSSFYSAPGLRSWEPG